MKKIATALALISLILLIQLSPRDARSQQAPKAVIYYFHGQFRCYSCTRMESLTYKALQQNFSKELAGGFILWRPINVDDPKNTHYINDYKLNTRSVIVSKLNGGKQVSWRNLDKVWNHLGDEGEFINYISTEIKSFIK